MDPSNFLGYRSDFLESDQTFWGVWCLCYVLGGLSLNVVQLAYVYWMKKRGVWGAAAPRQKKWFSKQPTLNHTKVGDWRTILHASGTSIDDGIVSLYNSIYGCACGLTFWGIADFLGYTRAYMDPSNFLGYRSDFLGSDQTCWGIVSPLGVDMCYIH